jgi:hypothetical protein
MVEAKPDKIRQVATESMLPEEKQLPKIPGKGNNLTEFFFAVHLTP